MNYPNHAALRLCAITMAVAALAGTAARAEDTPPADPAAFGHAATAALAAMKTQAETLGVKGVAIVAYAPGAAVTSWSSQMLVVGNLTKGPSGADKGINYLAIAYSKAGEMAATLKDSGGKERPPFVGEVGWQGGATSAGKTGLLFAAFSGGKGEQDYQISKAGLAVLGQSL
jgi:hypothetical protein